MLTVNRRHSIHKQFQATRDRQICRAWRVERHDKTGRQHRSARWVLAITGLRKPTCTGRMIKKCSLAVIGKVSAPASRIQVLVSGWIARHPQDALADDLHSAILLTSTRPTEGHSESYVCGDDVRPGGYELVRHRKNPHCGTFTAITKPFPRAIVLEAETRKVTTWESPSFPSLDGSAS